MRRCLLICEGPYDELVFSMLKNLFDESLLEVKPLGKCCLDTDNLKDNAESLINEMLSKEHGYLRSDFDEVCFLVDSDGVYVDEGRIIESKGIGVSDYMLASIKTPNRKSLIARNKRRVKNISDLLSGRKYWVFYNSRNLEHSFDGSLLGHLESNSKKRFALDILNKYDGKESELVGKLFSMNKAETINVFKSWDYLADSTNSLSSSSNVIIFVIMHFFALKAEYKKLILEMLK